MQELIVNAFITDRTRGNYDRFRLWEASAPNGTPPLPKEEFYS